MCESTPVGELCETRMAIMQVKENVEVKESFTNGEGEEEEEEQEDSQVVTTGKLSVNISGVVETASASCQRQGTHDHGDTQSPQRQGSCQRQGTHDHDDTRQSAQRDETHQHDTQTNGKNTAKSTFPIETYAGLDAANAERIKKFEAETKAMLTRPVAVGSSFSRSTQELSESSYQESTGSTSVRSSTLSARLSGLRGSMASLPRASNSVASLSKTSNSITSLSKASTIGNFPRSRHSLTSNSSVLASISSSIEHLNPPADHRNPPAEHQNPPAEHLNPLEPTDFTKIKPEPAPTAQPA